MKNDGVIAVVPVGYFDGFSRKHSNKGSVLIGDYKCPVIGRVYMNFLTVDLSDHTNKNQIKSGHKVTLLGSYCCYSNQNH